MTHSRVWIGILLPALLAAQSARTERGPYARIAILHPQDGHTVDFEAGYVRHLAWHQQVHDSWVWYGWTVTFGERQRWFVYASFAHSATSLDNPVTPAEDERDSVVNVAPYVDQWAGALYEFLPALSQGAGEPQPSARLEFTTVELAPGAAKAFETALSAGKPKLQGETLWYRMIAGGASPRYVRLRPRASLSAILEANSVQALPEGVDRLIAKMTVEILTLRPAMSLGLGSPAAK